MIPGIHRPAAVCVDLAAIRQNIKEEIRHLEPGQKLFAVVKANAYGHGAVQVAQEAVKVGVSGFCVAILDEALELRQAGIVQPILVLGVTPPKFVSLAAANDISLAVPNLAWLEDAEKILVAENADLVLKIHLAIDSGMGRIGFSEDAEFLNANNFLLNNPNFFVEGLFTHFASADSSDDTYFKSQVQRFNHLKKLLKVKPKWIHVDNTAASVFNKGVHSDLVRFGIGIYGLNPSSNPTSPDLSLTIKLKPALSFESELVQVHTIHANQGVGYGSTYVATSDQIIGTVPVGYADGFIRKFQGFKIKVGNEYCPIVGRICMDQLMVRLPHEMPVGTEVVLISNDPLAPNNIKAAADYVDSIHYEVACLLDDRLPRKYYGQLNC
ncbi:MULTISPECIES: alanine racemase [unclassified Lactobacillus]|uniref:alanine racemase n=1 Tax=unclassified Lactobacillus TaxID=2620435 RepID=UPI000EFD6E79|nr:MULTISPECIES: alanine racemase [unclassified Lactobacillus]RMC38515.1 alanine racemase [Lactobacillus sp. ESL0237]RMC42861.1 alanine racemase [Lactobacillus sp. ESL0234]RMC43715.1 alanine racemase [Lactobacillus sp. ESL0236]RMC44726.1 alanine racemase [Lactobacillus sp. ESL0230]RMC47966.1 alanine racemase [Lactobacillus sp. ESL0225]